jgi:hypothetical protein
MMHWWLLLAALVPGWFATQLLKQLRFVQKLKKVGIEVEATVISQRLVSVGRGSRQLLPRVAYCTSSGEKLIGESQEYGFKTEFFDGDIAVIVYDPDEPVDFLFHQELDLQARYLVVAFACFVTLLLVWAGVGLA